VFFGRTRQGLLIVTSFVSKAQGTNNADQQDCQRQADLHVAVHCFCLHRIASNETVAVG
jgi:hypothetical protein